MKHLGDEHAESAVPELSPSDIWADDAFLDALSMDATGELAELELVDAELAAMFSDLQAEVRAPLPPAPRIEELLGEAPVAPVISLDKARSARGPRRSLISGLIGAAAATLVIAGGGSAIYNATPGSALWPANQTLFGNHAIALELASTLEEADLRHNQGDVDGALKLLEQARQMADSLGAQEREKAKAQVERIESTITVTVTPPPAPAPAPESAPAEVPTVTVTTTVTPPPATPANIYDQTPGLLPTEATSASTSSASAPELLPAPALPALETLENPVMIAPGAVASTQIMDAPRTEPLDPKELAGSSEG